MKRISKILLVLLAVAMVFAISACGKKDKVLVMATSADFPPYEYMEDGKFAGIDVEIAQAIAAELGMELKIENMEFKGVITAVASGKADIGMAGLTVEEDRLVHVDFSDSYTTATQVIIVPENSDITGPDDLSGKKVGAQMGTTGAIYADEIDGVTLEQYNSGHEAILALTQGKIDAVVIDNEPARVFVYQNEGLKILDEELTVEEYAIAVDKGNTELLDKINAALAKLKENGTLEGIISKYIKAE